MHRIIFGILLFTGTLYSDGQVVNPGGGGGGSGTVTSVSVTTANGVSGTVATSTTTPAISLTLGAITPTSVATGDSNDLSLIGIGGGYNVLTFTGGTSAGYTGLTGNLNTTADPNLYIDVPTGGLATFRVNESAVATVGSNGITATADGVHAGLVGLAGNTSLPTIPANQFGWLGFNSTSATAYFLQPSTTAPSGNYLQCAAPSGNVSQCSWASGGGLPSSTNGQTYYSASGTGAATSAITVNSASAGSPIGLNGQTTHLYAGPTVSTSLNGALTSGSTSVVLTSGAGFPTSGLILVTNGGGSESEFIAYTSLSTNTLSGLTRGLYGTAARSLSNGDIVQFVTNISASSTSTFPSTLTLTTSTSNEYAVLADVDGNLLNQVYLNQPGLFLGQQGVGIVSPLYNIKNYGGSLQGVGTSACLQASSGANNLCVDTTGVPAVEEATLAVTTGSTTIAPVSGIVGLTGSAPTALATMTPPASCTVTGVGCEIKLFGVGFTTTTAGNFFAIYTVAANAPETCTYLQIAAPTANKWYCK